MLRSSTDRRSRTASPHGADPVLIPPPIPITDLTPGEAVEPPRQIPVVAQFALEACFSLRPLRLCGSIFEIFESGKATCSLTLLSAIERAQRASHQLSAISHSRLTVIRARRAVRLCHNPSPAT